jgi:hypothetical protein
VAPSLRISVLSAPSRRNIGQSFAIFRCHFNHIVRLGLRTENPRVSEVLRPYKDLEPLCPQLDAIHLGSALLWKDATSIDPVKAPHVGALGLAAQAHGLKVIGT